MKPLDPQKCPKQITILDALCEIADKSGSAVMASQLCVAPAMALAASCACAGPTDASIPATRAAVAAHFDELSFSCTFRMSRPSR